MSSGYRSVFGKTNESVYTLSKNEYPTLTYIPHIKHPEELVGMIAKGVVQSKSVSHQTFLLMVDLAANCFFYQKEAFNHSSPAFGWLYCPIMAHSSVPNSNMPICKRTPWTESVINSTRQGVIDFCIAAGMPPELSHLVTINAHLLKRGAGKGNHFDLMSTKDQKLIFFRGIASASTTGRCITFTSMKTTKERTLKGDYCAGLPGVEKHKYYSPPGCSFYATSVYVSGTHPAAWNNVEKTEGFQIMHDVTMDGDGECILLMFDAPFSSMQQHNDFFASLANNQVHLAGQNYAAQKKPFD